MREAESRMTTLLRIFLVPLLVTFVSERNVYAAETDKKTPEKPTTKVDYVLTVKNNLLSLNANDTSLKDVLGKMNRKAKIDALVIIPETEKIPVALGKLTIVDAGSRLGHYALQADSKRRDKPITNSIILAGLNQGRHVTLAEKAKVTDEKQRKLFRPEFDPIHWATKRI